METILNQILALSAILLATVLIFEVWIAKCEGRRKEKLLLVLITILAAAGLDFADLIYVVNKELWWLAVLLGAILLLIEALFAWVTFSKDAEKEKTSVV